MTKTLIYGARTLSIDGVKNLVAPAVDGVTFELHESDMWGGDYWLGKGPDEESWRIHLNQPDDDEPDDLFEEDHPEHRVLLQITVCSRSDVVRMAIGSVDGLDLLRVADER